CTSEECQICQPIRMPYNQFELLSFLPDPEISTKTTNEESQTGIFINTKIRLLICCDFCGKYRCIYSNTALDEENSKKIIQYFE
ncbi:7473_t:CDS:2, partial [Dentiscutata heterogama]